MFQGLLMRAERSIDQVIAKYMGRAMVAVPLLVATGFATAALTVELVELYGSVTDLASDPTLALQLGNIQAELKKGAESCGQASDKQGDMKSRHVH